MVLPRIYFPGTLWQFYKYAQPILENSVEIVVEPDRIYSVKETAEVFATVEGALLTAFEKIPRMVIDAAPHLRALSKQGAGIETIDLEAATERGIPVTNTPGANSLGVAEHTLALILSLLRRVPQLDRLVRSGRWQEARQMVGGDVEGSILGIVGFGHVGRLVGQRAAALGMQVLAYDPFQTADFVAAAGAAQVQNLDELLEISDVVSLHMTVTPQTRQFFDEGRFARMKCGAFLVNTARAALIDQEALIAAVRSNHLGGAALDVAEPEPLLPGSPLLELENVIITPHHAATTERTKERTLKQAATNLVRMLNGELPEIGLCNPEVLPIFTSRWRQLTKG